MLGPWLVGGDGIDHIGAYWQSADGDQATIDLNGPGPGSITTSLSTLSGWTTGATYRVSFSLAANPDNTLSPQSCVRATTATHQQDYCFNVLNTDGQGTQASSANMGWQRHTFEFTGAPTDHLTFTSLDAPGDAWGPALDHITVEKLVPTTGPGVRHLFTGKERDTETNLDYFGARYLSAAQGRFTSADAPFADQWEKDPQSWNLYSYARNNPLRFTDPRGRACVVGPNGNYDDNSGGQSCADVAKDNANLRPSSTTTAQGGNVATAFALNALFALSNTANNSFAWMFEQRPNVLQNTPTNREFTGQVAAGAVFVGTMVIGPGGGASTAPREIRVTWKGLLHVIQRHTGDMAGKSFFGDSAAVTGLVKAAEAVAPTPQAGGNFIRIVDAGRTIGTDVTTGQATSVYTVVTDKAGELVTAFPGRPTR
jgi:RHS repeat-associated protein